LPRGLLLDLNKPQKLDCAASKHLITTAAL
jgi:hypothetical protein